MKKKVLTIVTVLSLLVFNAIALSTIASARIVDRIPEDAYPVDCYQAEGRCPNSNKIGLLCTENTSGWTCRRRDCGGCE